MLAEVSSRRPTDDDLPELLNRPYFGSLSKASVSSARRQTNVEATISSHVACELTCGINQQPAGQSIRRRRTESLSASGAGFRAVVRRGTGTWVGLPRASPVEVRPVGR